MHPYQHKTMFYEKGRLGYAEEAVQLISELVPVRPAAIADMGSGTGLFSAALLDKGYRVYGVEPDGALLQKATERLHGFGSFQAVAASAESTGLPNHSVDSITAASAFHWFDTGAFRHECSRIIKPGGLVFLLYNVRQTDDAFSREQERICRRYCPEFTGFHHGADKAKSLCPTFFAGRWEERQYAHDLTYTKEQFLSRCLSSSYSPGQSHEDFPAYREALEQLMADDTVKDLLSIRNRTVVWYGTISAV